MPHLGDQTAPLGLHPTKKLPVGTYLTYRYLMLIVYHNIKWVVSWSENLSCDHTALMWIKIINRFNSQEQWYDQVCSVLFKVVCYIITSMAEQKAIFHSNLCMKF